MYSVQLWTLFVRTLSGAYSEHPWAFLRSPVENASRRGETELHSVQS